MSTRILSVIPTNDTDAHFRLWINEIHNALIAFGWTQATGVGTQIDFAAVTKPGGVSTYQGYAIYAAGDSLQATAPLFMRLDFGSGSSSASIPGLKYQLGMGNATGATSAGALLGSVSTPTDIANAITLQTTATDLRTAGSTGSFRLLWRVGTAAQSPMCFAVERDQSTGGADTGNGVNILSAHHSAFFSQFIEPLGGIGVQESRWYAFVGAQASQTAQGVVGAGPVRCALGAFRNPMKTVLVVARGDFAAIVQYPGVIYGVSRNYLIDTEPTAMSLNTWNTTCGVAILWE